ncbi:MAG: hypothetical protein V4690_00195 [Patescibacteria group bacterium]
MRQNEINWKKYIFSFIITVVIFATAVMLSTYFSNKKLAEIRNIQDTISIDILSSETQFALLEESSCKEVTTGALSSELGELESKLAYAEKDRGVKDDEVITLKKYYALLQIKDYLLMNKISEKCKKTPLSIIYFYSTDDTCEDCEKQGFVLTRLRETYPELRVYSFDYNTDLSAVKTLININKVKSTLPAIFFKEQAFYGFQSVEDLEEAIPELQTILKAKTATSTER